MILFAADCHGNFEPLHNVQSQADAVILLGDQEPEKDMGTELGQELKEKTWWIYGNHDADYESYLDNHKSILNKCLHCRVIEIEGIRIAGLNGVFSRKILGIDFSTRLHELLRACPCSTRAEIIQLRHGKTPSVTDSVTIFYDDIQTLINLSRKTRIDVLVLHEAPATHCLGYMLLSDLATEMGVKMVVHGHHHEKYSATLPSGIKVVGVGLLGKTEFKTGVDNGMFWLTRASLDQEVVLEELTTQNQVVIRRKADKTRKDR